MTEKKQEKSSPQVRVSVDVKRELGEELERMHRENGYAPNTSEVVHVALQALKRQREPLEGALTGGAEIGSAVRLLLRLFEIEPQTARDFVQQLSSQIQLEDERTNAKKQGHINQQKRRRSA